MLCQRCLSFPGDRAPGVACFSVVVEPLQKACSGVPASTTGPGCNRCGGRERDGDGVPVTALRLWSSLCMCMDGGNSGAKIWRSLLPLERQSR